MYFPIHMHVLYPSYSSFFSEIKEKESTEVL